MEKLDFKYFLFIAKIIRCRAELVSVSKWRSRTKFGMTSRRERKPLIYHASQVMTFLVTFLLTTNIISSEANNLEKAQRKRKLMQLPEDIRAKYLKYYGTSRIESDEYEYQKYFTIEHEYSRDPVYLPEGRIQGLNVSSNNKFCVSYSQGVVSPAAFGYSTKVWDLKKRTCVGRFCDSKYAQFSPNDKDILTVKESKIELWDIKKSQKLQSLPLSQVRSANFFSEDEIIVVDYYNLISSYNLKDKRCIYRFRCDNLSWYKFSHDNRTLATVSDEYALDISILKIWDLSSGTQLNQFQESIICYLNFSYDKNFIAFVTEDKKTKVYNLNTSKCECVFDHEYEISCAEFSHDNKYLLTASNDERVCVWDLSTKKEKFNFRLKKDQGMTGAHFSHDDKFIIITDIYFNNYVINIYTKKMIELKNALGVGSGSCFGYHNINSAQFCCGYKYIIGSLMDKRAQVWKLKKKKQELS